MKKKLNFNLLSRKAREAVACDHCFQNERRNQWKRIPKRPESREDDVAMAPWIGTDYESSCPRTVVMMLNPGHAAAEHKLIRKELGQRLRDGEICFASAES